MQQRDGGPSSPAEHRGRAQVRATPMGTRSRCPQPRQCRDQPQADQRVAAPPVDGRAAVGGATPAGARLPQHRCSCPRRDCTLRAIMSASAWTYRARR